MASIAWGVSAHAQPRTDVVAALYAEHCAVCHGDSLRGAAQGTPLVGVELKSGGSVEAIARSTTDGSATRGMPAWRETLSQDQIWSLALYIAERRAGTTLADFRYNAPLVMPAGVIKTERASFRLDTVVADLDPQPYGLAVLPGGGFLVTEKMRGLNLISADGRVTRITGTPAVYADAVNLGGQAMGLGWLMDVALHPGYANNGWVYLAFGDRCSACNERSRASGRPVSMNMLVRGRIKDGLWIDQQTIWQADRADYTGMFEIAAGGRIAFDGRGHVFFSIGMKGDTEIDGFQDLTSPVGKILRLSDDGGVPADNPFAGRDDALAAIWTFGHRSPQGLEVDPATGIAWNTEMGPRGGDELNQLRPGRNYGWPLVSKGVNYDGWPLDNAKAIGVERIPDDIERPDVDWTPSPAISSFIFYAGGDFPAWRGNIVAGTLRASDLYRLELKDGLVVHQEVLIRDLARIRDVGQGPKGELYILLEHDSGSRIVRLVPAR
jgi:glucose/arabinose dehydrogenase/cytochrome c553